MRRRMGSLCAVVASAAVGVLVSGSTGWSQGQTTTDPEKGSEIAAPKTTTGKTTKTGARETTKEARQEGRETAKDARRDARDVGRETREARRETLLRNLRAADLGLWFNPHTSVKGLVISDVSADGAIAKAGFKEGDRIVSINGQQVATEEDFMRQLVTEELRDEETKIVVMREGTEQALTVHPSVLVHEMAMHDPLWRSGIVLDERDPNKIVVLKVYPKTPAFYAGLKSGDVITGMRGQRIVKIADLLQGLLASGSTVDLQINRGNKLRDLLLNTGESAETRTVLKPSVESELKVDVPATARGPAAADQKPNLNQPKSGTAIPKR